MSFYFEEKIVVSRHKGAVDFILEELPEFEGVEVKGSVKEEDVAGKHVVGNLPLELASKASRVTTICFSGKPPRGVDYTVEDMRREGAYLKTFKVEEI